METKTQAFEVVLHTTDEEIDGETWIGEAVEEYAKKHNKKHVLQVYVNALDNEWDRED